jgi:hypothetical protein
MTAHPTYRRDRPLAAASRYPDRTALWVEGRGYTYRDLFAWAATVAGRLDQREELKIDYPPLRRRLDGAP